MLAAEIFTQHTNCWVLKCQEKFVADNGSNFVVFFFIENKLTFQADDSHEMSELIFLENK